MGLIRLKLTFTRGDEAPSVDPLIAEASGAMQSEVLDYVRSYRLPCMKPGQAPISAVQEFVFDALSTPEGKPLRVVEDVPARFCLVRGKDDVEIRGITVEREPVHVLVSIRFDGDGHQRPKIKTLASTASGHVEHAILENIGDYRMPCRQAGDEPQTFQQQFAFFPAGFERTSFRDKQMALPSFLSLMKNAQAERVYFDLNTMACPFQVEWIYMQPYAKNLVSEIRGRNPNRAEFMAWLSTLNFKAPERRAKLMVGAEMVVDVPCGVVDLQATKS
jgi:hypothetical protein